MDDDTILVVRYTNGIWRIEIERRVLHHISMRSVRAMMRPITAISFVRNPTLLRTKSFDEDWSSHGKNSSDSKIESALKVWHPANYGGYRVDSFRQGFDALEVPVECGSIKSGLVDFVRVQECFTSETKCGTCKLSMYRDEDRDLVMPSVRQWTQEVSCPKDIADWSFRNEPCTERFCRLYKTKHTYTIDTVITCVEIKVP